MKRRAKLPPGLEPASMNARTVAADVGTLLVIELVGGRVYLDDSGNLFALPVHAANPGVPCAPRTAAPSSFTAPSRARCTSASASSGPSHRCTPRSTSPPAVLPHNRVSAWHNPQQVGSMLQTSARATDDDPNPT